jgi:hypothetical protein
VSDGHKMDCHCPRAKGPLLQKPTAAYGIYYEQGGGGGGLYTAVAARKCSSDEHYDEGGRMAPEVWTSDRTLSNCH